MSHALRAIVLLVVVCFSQTSHAGLNSVFYDFDVSRGQFSPETYGSAGGNVYLGPFGNQNVALYMMDLLPPFNLADPIERTDRIVSLNFDLVFPSLSLAGVNDQFSILANGHLIFQQSFRDLSFLRSRQNVQTDFILRYQSIFDPDSQTYPPNDLILQFRKTGSSKIWGLDNVAIDWGRPVPEPSSAALAVLSMAVVACFRRKRRKILTA